jgi:hypothetical protein
VAVGIVKEDGTVRSSSSSMLKGTRRLDRGRREPLDCRRQARSLLRRPRLNNSPREMYFMKSVLDMKETGAG